MEDQKLDEFGFPVEEEEEIEGDSFSTFSAPQKGGDVVPSPEADSPDDARTGRLLQKITEPIFHRPHARSMDRAEKIAKRGA